MIMKCPDSAKSYVLLLVMRIPRSKHKVEYTMDCFQQSVKKIIKVVLTSVLGKIIRLENNAPFDRKKN